MAIRDIEDLILNTLVEVLADGTGISSGNIWLMAPETEFVNKRSGSIDAATNTTYLPSIGITYMRDAIIKHNNYGEKRYVRNSSAISTLYSPLGELNLSLAIHLYTTSHGDMNLYGSKLYQILLSTKLKEFSGDSIQGEYFSILLKSMRYVNYSKPIHKVFVVECQSRILSETSGYVVKEIITNLDTYDTERVNSFDEDYTVSGAIISVTTDPSNPLLVDTEDEFEEGSTERTEVL